jgi:hypothetical protein
MDSKEPSWVSDTVEAIDTHRATPHISIDAYTKQRQVELGQSLDGRLALYLDQKYWIALRKAEDGKGNESENELLRLLRELTCSGKVFCPISESVLMELIKQEDLQSRLRTAQMIDDLSSGVSLTSYDVRASTELAHLMYTHTSDPGTLHPLRHLMWLKSSYALGITFPVLAGLDPATQLALQKAFFDLMWSMPLVEVIKTIGQSPPPEPLGDLATRLNAGSAQHAEEIRSFAQTYVAESRGAVSVFAETAMNISRDISIKRGEPVPPPGSDEWEKQKRMWENLLFHILQKESERIKLPSIHVHACLHAAFRWNKTRQFVANDFYDFFHASAALACCQAFFTENSLHAVITAKHVALDKAYNCRVIANMPEAIAYLRDLNSA